MPVIQRHPDLVVSKPLPVEVAAPVEVPVEEQPDRQIPDQPPDEALPVEGGQPADEPSRMTEIPDQALLPFLQAPVGFAPREISPQRHSSNKTTRGQPQRYGNVHRFWDYEDFELLLRYPGELFASQKKGAGRLEAAKKALTTGWAINSCAKQETPVSEGKLMCKNDKLLE